MGKFGVTIVGLIVAAIGLYTLTRSPEIRNRRPQGQHIICFGDSLTAGTGATAGEDYPSRLAELLAQPVINAGRPGDTTADALQRLEDEVLARSPRMVLITLGGNDLKNGVAVKTAMQNLEAIVTAIQDRGALVVIGGLDVPLRDRGYSQAYRDLARDTGSVLIPNIMDGIFGRRELMSDPIHPNAAGYALIAERFYEAVAPYI